MRVIDDIVTHSHCDAASYCRFAASPLLIRHRNPKMAPVYRSLLSNDSSMYGDERHEQSGEHSMFKAEPQDPNRTLSSLPYDPLQPPLPTATLSSFYSHSPQHYPLTLEPPIPLTAVSSQISHSFLSMPPPPHSPSQSTHTKLEHPTPTTSTTVSTTTFTSTAIPPPEPLDSTTTLFQTTSFPFTFPPLATHIGGTVDYTQLSFPSFPSYSSSLSAYSSSLPPFDPPPLLASPSTHSTASTDSYLATSSLSSSPPSRSSSPDVASSSTASSATAPLPSPTASQLHIDSPDNVSMSPRPRPYSRGASRAAQPATVRRQKHREVDTTRRQKENIAFKKLAQLAARRVRVERLRGDEEEEEESEAGGGGEDERKAKAKLRVLQDSARKMAEMHTLIERLVDTNRSLVHQLARATNRPIPAAQQSAALALSILPPTGPQLEAAVVSQSLGSTLFLSSGVGQLVVDVASGSVVDVNDRFLAVTRWERPHMLGRILIAPHDLMTAGVAELSADRHRYIYSQSVLVDQPDGTLAPARLDDKIAMKATVDAVRALYRGEVDWCSVVWRLPLRDGRWYDVPCVNYVSGWVEAEEGGSGSGQWVRRPSTMMFLLYSTKVVPLE